MSRIGRLPVTIPSGVQIDIDGRQVTVLSIATGYRSGQLAPASSDPILELHRAFVERFLG